RQALVSYRGNQYSVPPELRDHNARSEKLRKAVTGTRQPLQ
ncbi:MAG: AAA family ATPase, partial [Rhodococcus erythropolis]